MRYVVAIILLLICHPCMAAKHRHKRHHHSHHRSAHHRSAHHSHSRHHRVAAHHARPKVFTADDLLSQQFEAQKGNLFFPIEQTANPVISKLDTHFFGPANGINITCRAGACVRTVYDGMVSSIFSVDNDDKMVVIVKHGNYFTVYNSVAHAAVKKGDRVAANQEIGTIAANDDGEPGLNFQIWKAAPGKSEKTKLDPEAWIAKTY